MTTPTSNPNLERAEGHSIGEYITDEMSKRYEFWQITQQTIKAAWLEAEQFTQHDSPLNVQELVAYTLIGISGYPGHQTVLRHRVINRMPQEIRPNQENLFALSYWGIINYANLSSEVSLSAKRSDIVLSEIFRDCPVLSTIACIYSIEGLAEELAEHANQWYTTHKSLEDMIRELIRSSLIITMANIDPAFNEVRVQHVTDIFSLIRGELNDFPPINALFINRIASPFPLAYAINAISSHELQQALRNAGFQIAHTEKDTGRYCERSSGVVNLMKFAIERGKQRASDNCYQELGIGMPQSHLPRDVVALEALRVLKELEKWLQEGEQYSQEPGRWQREMLRRVPDLEEIEKAEKLLELL